MLYLVLQPRRPHSWIKIVRTHQPWSNLYWIHTYTRATDSKSTLFLMCARQQPTETFQYTHFNSCHPPGVRKGFIKGEALRLLRTNSSKRNLKNTSHYSNNDYATEVIQITFWTWLYLKSILAKECRLYKINKQRAKEFCRLLRNTAHQYQISNIFLWRNGILYKTSPY